MSSPDDPRVMSTRLVAASKVVASMAAMVLVVGSAQTASASSLGPQLPLAETTQSELVLIRADDVVDEDLYALGQRVQIDGAIEGDLVAVGLEEVVITGRVAGSVTAIGAQVVVSGVVEGSLRVVARTVQIDGRIGEDVLASAWVVEETSAGFIGRDAIVAAWRGSFSGEIARDLEGRYRQLSLDGTVDGQVVVDASRTVVGDTAVVGDDLSVRAAAPIELAGGAAVGGEVIERRPLNPNVRVTAIGLLFRVLAGLGATLAGLALMWPDSARMEQVSTIIADRKAAVIVYGLGAILGPLAVIALMFGVVGLLPPNASLPLLLFVIPVTIGVVALLLIAALVAPAPGAIRIGSMVFSQRSSYAKFITGMAIVTALSFVPILGGVLVLAVVTVGFGAWLAAPETSGT